MAGTKKCRYCKQVIDKSATICPYCRKKQGIGCFSSLIVIAFFIVLIVIVSRSASSKKINNSNSNVTATTTISTTAPTSPDNENNSNSDEISQSEETTAPEETTPEETEYLKINGFVIGDKKGTSDKYGCTVYGVVRNDTGYNCSYVQISIGFYDESGAKVGSGIDNVLNLKSGEVWKYTVYGYGSGITTFKIEEIEWY